MMPRSTLGCRKRERVNGIRKRIIEVNSIKKENYKLGFTVDKRRLDM
jgi:hypothetical protein